MVTKTVPGFVKLMLWPAMRAKANSYHSAPYAADAGAPQVLLYSHGLISFASENSMLMEHLASKGYVVVALQHRQQMAELRALQKAQPEAQKREQAALEKRIKASSGNEKAELWRDYYRIAANTNRIVSGRSADIEYVVKELGQVLMLIPGLEQASAARIVRVVGLSLGGAVATEYAKQSAGAVRYVVNMDGGVYGTRLEQPLEAYYLMLCSQQNSGINDLSLRTVDGFNITATVLPGTKHLNLHDIAAVYRMLKWVGVTGSANPLAVVEKRNQLISDFFGSASWHGSEEAGCCQVWEASWRSFAQHSAAADGP